MKSEYKVGRNGLEVSAVLIAHIDPGVLATNSKMAMKVNANAFGLNGLLKDGFKVNFGIFNWQPSNLRPPARLLELARIGRSRLPKHFCLS